MKKIIISLVIVFIACGVISWEITDESSDSTSRALTDNETIATEIGNAISEDGEAFEVPEYTGEPSVQINDNIPELDDSLKTEESFETYGMLDKHGNRAIFHTINRRFFTPLKRCKARKCLFQRVHRGQQMALRNCWNV